MMKIPCNVHLLSFVAHQNLGGIGGELPHQEPLNLEGEFQFIYDYPLSKPAIFTHKLLPLNTAMDLLKYGGKDYQEIYRKEEEEAPVKTEGPRMWGPLNRSRTSGPYGVWGHDLSDLFFEGITVDRSNLVIKFAIGS